MAADWEYEMISTLDILKHWEDIICWNKQCGFVDDRFTWNVHQKHGDLSFFLPKHIYFHFSAQCTNHASGAVRLSVVDVLLSQYHAILIHDTTTCLFDALLSHLQAISPIQFSSSVHLMLVQVWSESRLRLCAIVIIAAQGFQRPGK